MPYIFRDSDAVINSLISDDVGSPEWGGSTSPTVHPTQFFASDVGLERASILNLIMPANGRGTHPTPFRMPAGCTGGILEVPMCVRSGSANVNLAIYDDALTTRLFEAPVTADTTRRWFQLPAPTLGPGQYWAAIEVNHASQQAQPVVFRGVKFTPNYSTNTSSVFGAAFQRISIRPGMMWGNYYTNWPVRARYFRQNAHAEWWCATNSPRVACQTWVQGPGAGNNQIAFLVAGQAEALGAVTNDLTIGLDEFNCPQRQGENVVGFRNGYQSEWVASSTYGQFLLAAYAPASASLRPIPPPPAARRLVIVTDSIGVGSLATNSGTQGWVSYLKTRFPGLVYIEGAGGRAIFHLAQDAATTLQTGQRIQMGNPTDILYVIGVNDFLNQYAVGQTQAVIQANFAGMVDKTRALCPNARQYAVSPLARTNEAQVIHDSLAITGIRAAELAVMTDPTRTDWASYKAGNAADMPGTSYLADGTTHPNNDGHAQMGVAIANFLGV